MSNAASSNRSADVGEQVGVTRNDDEGRYEARIAGDVGDVAGIAVFRRRPGIIVFTHTEVHPAFEGKGVGNALAQAALDDVRAQGWLAHPDCPFIRTWIKRHPDYADLVDPKWHLPEQG